MAKPTLAQIVELTLSETGFMYVPEKDAKAFAKSGFVEINEALKNDKGHVAVRATQAGIEAHNNAVAKAAADADVDTDEEFDGAEEVETSASGFEILDEPLPVVKQTRNRSSKYPFDKLAVGQSFKVLDSQVESGDAHKAMASAVAAANRRYSEVIEGEFTTVSRGAKVGSEVPARRQLRQFKQVPIAGGTQIGRVA